MLNFPPECPAKSGEYACIITPISFSRVTQGDRANHLKINPLKVI